MFCRWLTLFFYFISQAFSVFVNQNHKSPEYISLFIDENLKKGLKGARTYVLVAVARR